MLQNVQSCQRKVGRRMSKICSLEPSHTKRDQSYLLPLYLLSHLTISLSLSPHKRTKSRLNIIITLHSLKGSEDCILPLSQQDSISHLISHLSLSPVPSLPPKKNITIHTHHPSFSAKTLSTPSPEKKEGEASLTTRASTRC